VTEQKAGPHSRHLRFLIGRRLLQIGVAVVFVGGNLWGWTILRGNLSSSHLLGVVPFSDPFATLQLLAAGGRLGTQVLLGAGLTVLIYGLLGGRLFCSWICPMNPVTDLANFIGHKVPWFRAGAQDDPRRPLPRSLRTWLLALALVLSALLGTAVFEAISPVGMLQRGLVFGMGLGWWAVAGVFLFDLFVQRNGFCGHVCPLGACYEIVGRFSLLRIRHDHQKCTSCGDCLRVCPESQVLDLVSKGSGSILAGACTNCGRCVEVCHDDALQLTFRHQGIVPSSGG
jgi:ferredoxin-type protein NapH